MKQSFNSETLQFVNHANGLRRTLPLVMRVISIVDDKYNKQLESLIKKYHIKKVKDKNGARYFIPPDLVLIFNKQFDLNHSIAIASYIIPNNYIVSLISQFDGLIGGLIKVMFYARPELLNASEKSLPYSRIMEFKNIDEVKEFIIEKEVESVLRQNHVEQFEWLEGKLNIPLRDGLKSWKPFIEVTERRNLFVHCNGVISNQYLHVCRKHKIDIGTCKVGDTLKVSPDYFKDAFHNIFTIGVKLSHVLWRKINESERKDADENLISICFDLICYEDYDLAIDLLEFGTNVIKTWHDQDIKNTLIVNKAQAYKWSGNPQKCVEILNSVDWSAANEKFKLANYVLLEDYKSATISMRKIGMSGEVKKNDYRDWPLFKEFIKTDLFVKEYSKIFKEKYKNTKIEEVKK